MYIEIKSLHILVVCSLISLGSHHFSTMAVPHLFTVAILFLGILRTYSLPHEDVRLEFSTNPRLIYTASESNSATNGYSYSTRDINGGRSKVVFTTGADSVSRLKNEINPFYKANVMRTPEKYSQEDISDKTRENPVSSEQPSKAEEAEPSMNEQEDYNLNIEISNENNPPKELNYHELLHQLSFLRVPYPAFEPDLLNLQLPTATLPRYHILQNAIQSQDHPHNFYDHLELLPSHNFDFYEPPASLFYHAPIATPANNLRHASTTVEGAKTSTERGTTESSRINATVLESSSTKSGTIKSRFNSGPATNTVDEASLNEPVMSKFKSAKKSEEITTTGEIVDSTMKTETSNEQTMKNRTNDTEVANNKTCAYTKKSDTETSTTEM